MPSFQVVWRIDIEDVDTPREAAKEALEIQRDGFSEAVAFEVTPPGGKMVDVDLLHDDTPIAED